MLRLIGPAAFQNEPVHRREMLRIGGLGMTGLGLSGLMDLTSSADEQSGVSRPASFGKAKNCIVLFQSGGAAHLDTYDPKPDAPEDVRGDFGTIQTKLPGVHLGEHMSLTASLLDKGALV